MRIVLTFFLLHSLLLAHGQHMCASDSLRIHHLQQHPGVAQAVIARDAQLEAHTQSFSPVQRSGNPYVIPVVFHIVHNYGPENIADAQVHDALRIINENFRKRNADTANIVPAFQGIAADCEIEFRLAQKDPNGNCTRGINRIASTTTYSGGHEVKQLIQWNPTMYLNVYVVNQAAGLAGHAVWPSDADTIPEWDGIVISHDYLGSIGTSAPTRSMVLSHEIGHYLNLQHIWGGNNVPGFYYLPCANAGNCAYDDGVMDTPNTIGWQSCALNGASCGNVVDNVQNFMDYSYCGIMFTEGQKTRMHACLNSSIAGRNNLWSASNLMATGTDGPNALCGADVYFSKRFICAGQSVTFTDQSYHGVTTRSWNFFGANASSLSDSVVTVSYSTPGVYDVYLQAGNGTSTVDTLLNDLITVYAVPGVPGMILESFENVSALPNADWYSPNPQNDSTFRVTDLASFTGSHSLVLDNFQMPAGLVEELITVPRDISGLSQVQVSFRHAFARKDTNLTSDRLQVYSSNDCGATWFLKKTITAANLPTASPTATPYFPGNSGEWVYSTIPSFSASSLTDDFMLKFVFTTGGGNNFFLEDINIGAYLETEDLTNALQIELAPNPANESCRISIHGALGQSILLSICDLSGKLVSSQTHHSNSGEWIIYQDLSTLENGYYFIRIQSEFGEKTLPLVVSH